MRWNVDESDNDLSTARAAVVGALPNSRRRRVVGALLLGAVLAVTVGCSSDDNDSSSASNTTTAPAAAGTTAGPTAAGSERLDVKAFAERVAQPGVVLVDVRTPAEYAEGHIANAKNLDVRASDFTQRLASLDKAASYAVYCHSGNRSQTAVQQMRAAGFTKTADLVGGITAWSAAGHPVTKS